MKKRITDYEIDGKRVIVRVDFNVPIKDGIINDDNRIKESLKTIKYCIENNAKVILMSHLGKVKSEEDKKKNTLKPISVRLSELLNMDVIFVPYTRGSVLEKSINNLQNGQVLLMENTRFEDYPNKLESSNDDSLGKYWSNLGDIFINDAFGTSHRAHASNVGIASNLPNGIGFLIDKELEVLEPAINNPKRPLTVILGGAKVEDKIGVIENLVKIADNILIGGGMAYTFLKAEGYGIGKSLLDEASIDFCKKVLKNNASKIVLPIDVVVGLEMDANTPFRICPINEIKVDEMGLDIGDRTVKIFEKYLTKSGTIIWNGPVGVFEIDKFSQGTKKICEILSRCANTIIGGGDTGSAVINMGYKDYMSHISTGGGASLELLEGKILPGIDIIQDR